QRQKRGLNVEVHNNNVTKAWRKLKRLINEEGILQELRDRKQFDKPSVKRRKAQKAAKQRWAKKKAELDNY
nr:30S ribosomal protein S21 [Candidatus Brocadiales bacterium]